MEIQVAIIILLVVAIIAVLAIFLIATIVQLFKINSGLSVVLPLVGQIVQKSAPVNPVVDDINKNLVVTRDALENLMWKKAGPDSPGVVESLFPGEGEKFLKRTGRSGKVVNVGTVYTRGVGGTPASGVARRSAPRTRRARPSATRSTRRPPPRCSIPRRPGGATRRRRSPRRPSPARTRRAATSPR